MQTYLPVDAWSLGEEDLGAAFRTFGVLKVKNVLSGEETRQFLEAARRISGLSDADYLKIRSGEAKHFASPGSVVRHEELWPIVYQERLVAVVRAMLGPAARFFGRDSLGVHFSSVSFHTDTKVSDQIFGVDGYPADFSTVRVIFYLSEPGRPATRFGFKPFSHRRPRPEPPDWARPADRRDEPDPPIWLDLDPGDCVMFDARLSHSGDEMLGPKYMIVLTYDVETDAALRVFHQTCVARADDGYGYEEFSPAFLEVLRDKGLMITGLDEPSKLAARLAQSMA